MYTWKYVVMVTIYTLFAVLIYTSIVHAEVLTASWYSRADLVRDGQDKRTHFIMANGKEFKDDALVCASWDWPLGTWVCVTNRVTGAVVVVRVSDRTARRFKGKRIDLSKGAFNKIADCKQGIVQVLVERLEK